MWKNIARQALHALLPRFCYQCGKEGELLCCDCAGLLEISHTHRKRPGEKLTDLYVPCSYENRVAARLIHGMKYKPFLKELARPLARAIWSHLELLDNKPDFSGFTVIAVPLAVKRMRWRGFNQAEAIAGKLAGLLSLETSFTGLIRTRETPSQAELSGRERLQNIKNAFSCPNNLEVKGKKFLLVDDVVTTGATMEECAKVLRRSGALEVIGIAVAHGNAAK